MAITVYGVPPNITAQKWSELFKDSLDGGAGDVVKGFAPSVATGTRKVDIAAGSATIAGVRVESNAVESVTLANADGPRLDVICLQVDWNGTTQSTAGTIVVVEGVPLNYATALTQTPGDKWQIPLAFVVLSTGVGQLPGSAMTDVRPTRREQQVYRPNVLAKQIGGSGWATLVDLEVPPPGYRYTLAITAQVNMSSIAQGHGQIELTINGDRKWIARAGDGNEGLATIPYYKTGPLDAWESTFVRLHMNPQNIGGATLESYPTYSYFQAVREPF